MEASRTQPGTLEGLSRFLVEHEECGAGFDVAHPAGIGSGRVGITCRGCGARHEYATATIEVEREVRIERVPTPANASATSAGPIEAKAVPSEPAADVGPDRKPPQPPVSRPRRLEAGPSTATAGSEQQRKPLTATATQARQAWRSPAVTVILIGVSILALAFVLFRVTGDSDDEADRAQAPPTAGSGGTPNAQQQQQQQQPSAPAPEPPAATPEPGPAALAGSSPVETDWFSIRLPADWERGRSGGGLLLRPQGGGAVSVQVFYEEAPGLTLAAMEQQTADFLRRRNPDATLTPAQPLRVAGSPGFAITARGPGRTERATVVASGDLRYLVVRSARSGAAPRLRAQAIAVEKTFRPS